LLERDAELEVLGRELRVAARGDGRLITVVGSPGIGKTRLIAEAARLAAERGALALRATGAQHEQGLPYGVARQLFEPVLRDRRLAGDLLKGQAASAAPLFEAAPESHAGDGERTLGIVHGLFWVTINLGERRPLLLAVDDAQWADTPSLRFLTYLGTLTSAERRVARLAADGLKNREIAEELYATPRTVEDHLSSSYRKLGIRSRAELANVLAADA
jgi:DNA-binding CsgD family transcriptional regulator